MSDGKLRQLLEEVRTLVGLWKNGRVNGLPRSDRNAAIEATRERIIALVDAGVALKWHEQATRDAKEIIALTAELATLRAQAGEKEPLETCCFCNKPIGIGQAYDRLDAAHYFHLGCWPNIRARSASGQKE